MEHWTFNYYGTGLRREVRAKRVLCANVLPKGVVLTSKINNLEI
jgi:hypothetical protein